MDSNTCALSLSLSLSINYLSVIDLLQRDDSSMTAPYLSARWHSIKVIFSARNLAVLFDGL